MTMRRFQEGCVLALAGLLIAVTPAAGAISRPVVQLDGDPTVGSLDSEDVLLRRGDGGREFGAAIAVCDVNHDLFDDVVVGHREASRVLVYLGGASLQSLPWFDDPNAADVIISAPGGGADRVEGFGFSVACGDLDDDDFDDIIVGAPFSDPGNATDAGRAFVILGGGSLATGQVFTVSTPPAGVTVLTLTRGSAARAGDLLGFAIATGALGASDRWMAVSARDADATAPARDAAGAVHVVRGSALPMATGPFDLSAGAATTFFGPDASDAFGEALAGCDIDNGGSDDLVIGAIFGDGPAGTGINRGEVRVFLGENVASGFFAGDRNGSTADLSIFGATNGDDFGFSVACGDLTGDMRGEIVAGAVYADATGDLRPTAGEVSVLRGRASAPDPNTPTRWRLLDPVSMGPQGPIDLSVAAGDLTLLGATTADQLGFSVAVGDLDGDGFGDLLAAARRFDRDQTNVNVGATYIRLGSGAILGAPGSHLTIDLRAGTNRPVVPGFDPNVPIDNLPSGVEGIVVGADREDHSGFALATGDLNRDPNAGGGDELLVGAIGDPAFPAFRGEVYVMSYQDRDGDGSSDVQDRDNDNDGISDADEIAGAFSSEPTDPFLQDTDDDGIQDGTELRFTCDDDPNKVACDDPNRPYTSTDDTLAFFFREDADPNAGTDPNDFDSDDDGLADGAEDANGDGDATGTAETNPRNHDTDADGIFDGTETGLFGIPHPDTNIGAAHYIEDVDHGVSVTLPWDADTDNDTLNDGIEDADHNGAVLGDTLLDHQIVNGTSEIWQERDPTDPDTDRDGLNDGREALLGSSALDQDSDDDGLPDGWIDTANGGRAGCMDGREGEDLNRDGMIGLTESHPINPDTDGDGMRDGSERGLVGGGVSGRNGTLDAGPGGDGTDLTSTNRGNDADAGACTLPLGTSCSVIADDLCSVTLPNSGDSDADGILDNVEDANLNGGIEGDLDGNYIVGLAEIWTETDANHPDSDRDGLPDGREDKNGNGIIDPGESDPLDQDTDDDGLPDGRIPGANGADPNDAIFEAREGEDRDLDGVFGSSDGESSPLRLDFNGDSIPDTDSDADGIPDGVEAGVPPGGGVNGRNTTPDGGPGGDGTDTTSASFIVDADPNSRTFPWDADHDDDGLPDGVIDGFNPNPGNTGGLTDGIASVFEGEDLNRDGLQDAGETDPLDRESDGDGVNDGAERGVLAPGVPGRDMLPDPASGGIQDGTRPGGATLDADESTLTSPLDSDHDDDGFSDGAEDRNGNGMKDSGGVACTTAETDPTRFDTDSDQLSDGLECGLDGVNPPLPIGTNTGVFTKDLDPNTKTDPNLGDTDAGSRTDGDEDAIRNGRLDDGERNPLLGTDDDRDGAFEFTDAGGTPIVTFAAGSPLFIRLIDQDQNPDPNTSPTVTVTCASSFPDLENKILQDTEIAVRGRFLGTLQTSTTGTPNNDATLSVAASTSVTCTYTDPDDPEDMRMASIPAMLAGSLLPEPQVLFQESGTLSWSAAGSPGGVAWNVYGGNLAALRQTGVYTQQILACGLGTTVLEATGSVAMREIRFYLVSASAGGVEGALGRDSAGHPHPVSQSCEP